MRKCISLKEFIGLKKPKIIKIYHQIEVQNKIFEKISFETLPRDSIPIDGKHFDGKIQVCETTILKDAKTSVLFETHWMLHEHLEQM